MHDLVINVRRQRADVYCGRPGPWGNPFVLNTLAEDKDLERKRVIHAYACHLADNLGLVDKARDELAGKTLGCYCTPQPCHADLLARVAEGMTPAQAYRDLYYPSTEE